MTDIPTTPGPVTLANRVASKADARPKPVREQGARAYVDEMHDRGYEAVEIIQGAERLHKEDPDAMTAGLLASVRTVCEQWIAESEGRRA